MRTAATTDEAVVAVVVAVDVVDVVCDVLPPPLLDVGDNDAALSLVMASQTPPIVVCAGCGEECVAVVAFAARLTLWLTAVGRTAPELQPVPPLAPPPPTDDVDDDDVADAAVENKPRCSGSGFFVVGFVDAAVTSFFVCLRCAATDDADADGEAVVCFFIVVLAALADDFDAPAWLAVAPLPVDLCLSRTGVLLGATTAATRLPAVDDSWLDADATTAAAAAVTLAGLTATSPMERLSSVTLWLVSMLI